MSRQKLFSCLSSERVNGSLCLLRGNLGQSVLRGNLDQIPEFSNNYPYQGPGQYQGDLSRKGGGWERDQPSLLESLRAINDQPLYIAVTFDQKMHNICGRPLFPFCTITYNGNYSCIQAHFLPIHRNLFSFIYILKFYQYSQKTLIFQTLL